MNPSVYLGPSLAVLLSEVIFCCTNSTWQSWIENWFRLLAQAMTYSMLRPWQIQARTMCDSLSTRPVWGLPSVFFSLTGAHVRCRLVKISCCRSISSFKRSVLLFFVKDARLCKVSYRNRRSFATQNTVSQLHVVWYCLDSYVTLISLTHCTTFYIVVNNNEILIIIDFYFGTLNETYQATILWVKVCSLLWPLLEHVLWLSRQKINSKRFYGWRSQGAFVWSSLEGPTNRDMQNNRATFSDPKSDLGCLFYVVWSQLNSWQLDNVFARWPANLISFSLTFCCCAGKQ